MGLGTAELKFSRAGYLGITEVKMYSRVDLCVFECFSLPKSHLKSLDFAVTRFLMKLFKTSNKEIIAKFQRYFGFSLTIELTERKRNRFVNSYSIVSSF